MVLQFMVFTSLYGYAIIATWAFLGLFLSFLVCAPNPFFDGGLEV